MAATVSTRIDVSGAIPAPSVGAPAGPSSPIPDDATFNISLSEATLEEYSGILARLNRLVADEVEMHAKNAHGSLDYTQEQSRNAQELLRRLQQVLEKETEDFEKVDGKWYPGKLIKGKAKHTARVQKEEEEMNKAQADVDQQMHLLAQLQQQAAQQAAQVQQLDAQVQELGRLRAYEAALVERVFKGDAGDVQENQLERAVDELANRLASVREYAVIYTKVEKMMQAAFKHANTARDALQQALSCATADLATNIGIGGGGIGAVVAIRRNRAVQAGQHHAMLAAESVVKAKQLLPSIPHVDLSKAQELARKFRGGLDIVFDNMITDYMVHQRIQKDLSTLQSLREEIKDALTWVSQWLQGRINQDYAAAQAQYAQQKASLDAHRRDVLQRLITNRQGPTRS